MRDNESLKRLVWGVSVLYLLFLVPVPAMALDPSPSQAGVLEAEVDDPLIFPPQEEGKLDLPPAVSKPWYKKWWAWTIVVALAGGAAAAAGAGGGGGGGGNNDSSTGSIAVDW